MLGHLLSKQFVFISLLTVFIQPMYAAPVTLNVIEKTMMVNGKPSRVFDVSRPDGKWGIEANKGDLFDVNVVNKTRVPLTLHWHGIVDPNPEDGVPYVTQKPIPPGSSRHYQYTLKQSGTYWFHSHYQLQEQKLMAGPLIIHDPADKIEPEAVMFVQDFSFTDPKILYENLRNNKTPMDMSKHHSMGSKPDLNDVKFDAYLTNHKTLNNPEIVRVTPGQTIRLRIINASASSSYYVDFGKLTGQLIAIDGENIQPISEKRFQMTIGNRLDVRVTIPSGEGAYPILALPEGTKQQTGLILATANAQIPQLTETRAAMTPALDYSQETRLHPLNPFQDKPIQQTLRYKLNGDMQPYAWTINGQEWPYVTPLIVKPNQRVAIVFENVSGMAHPMHIHGHIFQVIEINGKKVNGRKGDTFDVMPNSTFKIIFDTDNRGIWVLHCHILYHMMGGMMTTVNYAGYPDKFTTAERAAGEHLYENASQPLQTQ